MALLMFTACGLAPPATPPADDALLTLYRNDRLRSLVIDYYANLTRNRGVALAILETCDDLNLDPSLAFALAWNESHFNPYAVNDNGDTLDRGLFQLNSRTFPKLSQRAAFDPLANARSGLQYYRRALTKLGSHEKALGYYNAGIGLLTNRPLPRSTQAYIRKILADRDRMDRDAIAWLYFSHEPRLALRP